MHGSPDQAWSDDPEAPYTVELPEPLGDRDVIDAMSIGIGHDDYVR